MIANKNIFYTSAPSVVNTHRVISCYRTVKESEHFVTAIFSRSFSKHFSFSQKSMTSCSISTNIFFHLPLYFFPFQSTIIKAIIFRLYLKKSIFTRLFTYFFIKFRNDVSFIDNIYRAVFHFKINSRNILARYAERQQYEAPYNKHGTYQ